MEENIEELTKKAEQGDVEAQLELSANYYYGKNVEQDYVKAFFWSEKAAKQGNATGQNDLGGMYRTRL